MVNMRLGRVRGKRLRVRDFGVLRVAARSLTILFGSHGMTKLRKFVVLGRPVKNNALTAGSLSQMISLIFSEKGSTSWEYCARCVLRL